MVAKARKITGFIMRRSNTSSNPETLKIFYISLVRSHIEFAAPIWRKSNKNFIIPLGNIQKQFLKFFTRIIYHTKSSYLNINFNPCNNGAKMLVFFLLYYFFIFNIVNLNLLDPNLLEKININILQFDSQYFILFHLPRMRTEILIISNLKITFLRNCKF